jgi:uncharacterized protein
MEGKNVYLDSSAIVKRYLIEEGTEIVDRIFREAEIKDAVLHFSIWNVGEVVGALDKESRKGRSGSDRISYFLKELRRLINNNSIRTVEITLPIILDAASVVLRYKLYVADAIQIVSAKQAGCDKFFTGDKRLHKAAVKEGIDSTYLGG